MASMPGMLPPPISFLAWRGGFDTGWNDGMVEKWNIGK